MARCVAFLNFLRRNFGTLAIERSFHPLFRWMEYAAAPATDWTCGAVSDIWKAHLVPQLSIPYLEFQTFRLVCRAWRACATSFPAIRISRQCMETRQIPDHLTISAPRVAIVRVLHFPSLLFLFVCLPRVCFILPFLDYKHLPVFF